MFAKDADEQLEADAIILDEVSMMDIVLMQHFLRRCRKAAMSYWSAMSISCRP
jgi:ATP-dependent exoDNAse (exonuclease V) alpha subunit